MFIPHYSQTTSQEYILYAEGFRDPAVAVTLLNNPTLFGIPDKYYDLSIEKVHLNVIKHAHANAINMGHSEQVKMGHDFRVVERDNCANYNPARDEILENRISNDLKEVLDMDYHSLLEKNQTAEIKISTLIKKALREDNTKDYWNTLPFPGRVEILEVVTFFNDLANKSVNELATLYSKKDLDFYHGRELVTTKLEDSTFTKADQEKLEGLKLIVDKIVKKNVAYRLQNLLFKDFDDLEKKNKPVAKEIVELTKSLRQNVAIKTYWHKLNLEHRIETLEVVTFLNDLSRESIRALAHKYLVVNETLYDFIDHELLKSRRFTEAEQLKINQVIQSKKKNQKEKSPKERTGTEFFSPISSFNDSSNYNSKERQGIDVIGNRPIIQSPSKKTATFRSEPGQDQTACVIS